MNQPTPKPVFTTVPIQGLKKEYKILHITDLHASEFTEAEAGKMPPNRLAYIEIRRTHWAGGRSFVSAEALPMLIDYAKEIKADLILMTGDMLDFPSEANLGLMEACIKASAVPVLYITGNHDWSYADDYHTEAAAATYLTRVDAISNCVDHAVIYESDGVLVCAVDSGLHRIREETLAVYLTAARRAKAEGKALILALHVPIHAETLVEDTVRVWRQELTIGESAFGADDPTTMAFYNTVTAESDLAPDAVIAGHLHFDHEDIFPNGIHQYITDIACDGHCRVLTLIPAESC
ncbi:MAG: metallophosphoesterase [Clostridia bacterium]|nr:metallophosphoesterase [Clostridia bacterium]